MSQSTPALTDAPDHETAVLGHFATVEDAALFVMASEKSELLSLFGPAPIDGLRTFGWRVLLNEATARVHGYRSSVPRCGRICRAR